MKGAMTQCQQQLGTSVTAPVRLFAGPPKHQTFTLKGSSATLQGVKCQQRQHCCTHTGTNVILMGQGVSVHSTLPKPPCSKADWPLQTHIPMSDCCGFCFRLFSLSFFTRCVRQEYFRELERPQRLYLN